MRIGELAQRTGTTTRALRFYEAQGLLPAARAANGYREYDEDHLRLVKEIQTLRTVGFSLDDTRPFVDCLRTGHDAGDACPASVEVYRRKLDEVEACMRDLAAVRSALLDKLAAATGHAVDPCTAEPEESR
ncbi:MerR family transcriptional regulator [Amycolatopsis rubida]|uniref:DNA-binding transcriptional regulator, MerR family n=1 Tax=Amycolatopsis rubida TaxID=112413 RepID=A0A1I5IAE8_9PSEU|nr:MULTISPECIES: MerR family transcriptional regulator [Amycolatopsis]MYW96779.1 MerR family transcriptional regulator [Amycolatopsis rubida]NEC61764.1 MerR family transcriptional regulator [Amycolatopsis rubida]SFO57543.1 DNA-binding transcriptional regulator, MerR family [Amycolatopsis rubida]